MPKKVTHADAQLILQLYDLRREAEMRKARNWVATQFWPQSADDYIKVASAGRYPGERMAAAGDELLGYGGRVCAAWRAE